MKIKLIVTGLLFLGMGQFAVADTFEEGGEAYKKGDYETTAKKFRDVAKK
jgi:hypothetical protein